MQIQFTRTLPLFSVVCFGLLITQPGQAEVQGTLEVSSNYVWRGVSQSADSPGVSGGLDYSKGSFYGGVWVSNAVGVKSASATSTHNNYEFDVYGGYSAATQGGINYDVGVIGYLYPIGVTPSDFGEVYANASYSGLDGSVSYTFDAEGTQKGDIYTSLSYDLVEETQTGLGVEVGAGYYKIDSGRNYSHVTIGASKGDLTMSLDKNNIPDDNDYRVSVKWVQTY